MSTSSVVTFRRYARGTITPQTRQILRSPVVISLMMVSTSPSAINSCSASNVSTFSCPRISISASTDAFWQPARISPRSARPPSTRLILSTKIDLPAPVSPLSTCIPLSKVMCICSMSAMFCTVIDRSIQQPLLSVFSV